MFENGFPIELAYDVKKANQFISKSTYNNIKSGKTDEVVKYKLLDGQTVSFPYRIYYIDDYEIYSSLLTFQQKMIYHCIFTRSCNGYIREKHVKSILCEDYPDWVIPYIMKVCDEYVVEILETVYREIKHKDVDRFKTIALLNLPYFLYSYARMISYWNEFYRNKWFHYKDYIGSKLYKECFGYTRSMEKYR